MSDSAKTGERIVVGVDGSEPSQAALRWAVAQGQLSGATVEAIAAWEPPTGWYGMLPQSDRPSVAEETVERHLTEAVTEAVGAHPSVEVRRTVAKGNPAAVLLGAARDAQLLVVGNRGRGGFTEALLGSVSQHCTQHATCPVVVIRAHK